MVNKQKKNISTFRDLQSKTEYKWKNTKEREQLNDTGDEKCKQNFS